MDKMNRHFHKACLALASIVLLHALALARPGGVPSESTVVLTGWLHVDDLGMGDVTVEVEVDGRTWQAQLSEGGRFTVALPAEAEAILRFEKPGHLTKEVVVDTRHARIGGFQRRDRRIRFAVVLEQERHMAGLAYRGPVGKLSFEEGGGCLAVAHDRTMVPARRAKQMVF